MSCFHKITVSESKGAEYERCSMRLSVMTASALFGIAMDQVSPYSVARARLRVPTRHSICALSKVSWKKGGQDEGEDTYTALVSWLIAAGGFVHEAVALTPNDGTGGRGLVAARDIARGEQLIVVPEKAQLFYSRQVDHRADRSLLALIDTVNPMLWGMQLGLRLLVECTKREASYFAPYIKSLPSEYGTIPAYFTQRDLTELQFPDIQRKAAGRMAQLDLLSLQCERIRGGEEDPFKGEALSKTQLIWATCSVSSRAYRVRGKSGQRGGHLASLLPVVDLINHSFEANCIIQDAAERGGPGAVAVVAAIDVAAGEALRTNYGEIGNEQLLLNYGFVLDDNPHDTLSIPVGALSFVLAQDAVRGPRSDADPAEAEAFAAQQLRLLVTAGASDLESLTLEWSGALDARSMALVRVLVMRSLDEIACCGSALDVQVDRVEERARQVVARLCQLAQEEMATEVTQDLAIIHNCQQCRTRQVSSSSSSSSASSSPKESQDLTTMAHAECDQLEQVKYPVQQKLSSLAHRMCSLTNMFSYLSRLSTGCSRSSSSLARPPSTPAKEDEEEQEQEQEQEEEEQEQVRRRRRRRRWRRAGGYKVSTALQGFSYE